MRINNLNKVFRVALGAALFISFVSCDDKIESLENLNSAPTFEMYGRKSTSWEPVKEKIIYDSAKVYTPENNMNYSVVLKMTDVNSNFGSVDIGTYDTDDLYYINNIEYSKNQRVPLDSFSIAYKNKNVGLREFDIKAEDDFGKSNQIKFFVFFAQNKKPIANLELNLKNQNAENEYELDASGSKDGDADLGGFIREYEYIINDKKIIKSSLNKIYHVFTPGDYVIRLRVKDNDDEWSPSVSRSIYIKQ